MACTGHKWVKGPVKSQAGLTTYYKRCSNCGMELSCGASEHEMLARFGEEGRRACSGHRWVRGSVDSKAGLTTYHKRCSNCGMELSCGASEHEMLARF